MSTPPQPSFVVPQVSVAPALLTAATSRRRRRAEAAAGSNDDVEDREHERAEPEIDADADAASRRTTPKPNSKHAVAVSPHHGLTLLVCLAFTSDKPYGEQ